MGTTQRLLTAVIVVAICFAADEQFGVPTREIRRDVEASNDRAKQEFARERASQADRTWENEVGERPDSELDEVVDESRESENGETIAFGSLVSAGISPASRFGRGVSCMGRAPQQAPASIIISCVSPTHEFFPKLVLESGSSRIRFPVATKIALHSAGINGGTPGSPTPAGGASLSTR